MSFFKPFLLSSIYPNEWGRRDWQLALVYTCVAFFSAPYLRDLSYAIRHSISHAIEKRRIRKSLPKGEKREEGSVTESAEQDGERDFEAEREVLRAQQQRKLETQNNKKNNMKKKQLALTERGNDGDAVSEASGHMPIYEVQLPAPTLRPNRSTTSTSVQQASTTTNPVTSSSVTTLTGSSSSSTSSSLRRRYTDTSTSVGVSSSTAYAPNSNRSAVVDARLEQERLLKAQQDWEYQQSILKELEKQEVCFRIKDIGG